jgi:hemin uptake protein HemP
MTARESGRDSAPESEQIGEGACTPKEVKDPASSVRTVSSRELLGGRAVVLIEHDGECYTLRLTRNNRLILTK